MSSGSIAASRSPIASFERVGRLVRSGHDSRLRVAIAGAGFASGMHLQAWARIRDVEVLAICDVGNLCVPGAPATPVDRLQLTGTEGVVSLDDNVAQVAGRHSRRATFDLATGYPDSYAAALEHFVQSLRTGERFETDVRGNLQTLALVEQSYEKSLSVHR